MRSLAVMIGAGHIGIGHDRLHARRMRSIQPELPVLLALTTVLNLWHLSGQRWANGYYAAAVRSMAGSWHNFLFGSFDPSGVMTVDKPPLALWVQALSVRVFGYRPLSILVPEALMGIGTVALTYDLVRRRFGRVAGLVAGLTLAVTPATMAMSRHNNPDSLLILCCVGALWLALRGLDDGRTRWIVWAGVLVGLGFEAKMGTALLVVPAIAGAWLWGSQERVTRSIRQLLIGGLAMVPVAGAWPLLVTLTPAGNRPWISGTNDNNIWSLITGYNGLGRITGQSGALAAACGGSGGGGNPGVFRLLNSALGSQAGWLLGFALVSGIGLVVLTRLRRRDATSGWTIAVGGAFLTTAIAFSAASGIFRPYYVSFLSPFIAALVGAGAGQLAVGDSRARRLAPFAIGAGVLTEVAVLQSAHVLTWLEPVIICLALAAAAAFVLLKDPRLRLPVLAAALAALAIAPAAWKLDGGSSAATGAARTRGSVSASAAASAQNRIDGDQSILAALSFAKTHGGGTLAVWSQAEAETPIIHYNGDLAGIGGFSGTESQVSAAWLAQEFRAGRLRWVLEGSGALSKSANGGVGSQRALRWVSQACPRVANLGGSPLYDCSGRAAQILRVAHSA